MSSLDDWLRVQQKCRDKLKTDRRDEIREILQAELLKKNMANKKPKPKMPDGWDDCIEIDITPCEEK